MLKTLMLGACSVIALSAYSNANADEHHTPTPIDHAPIGIMGDHLHKENEWMLDYRYELNSMSGFKNGTKSISTANVLNTYGEGATKMDMQMHMFSLMYGITDKLSVMAMPQYMQMDMTHVSLHGSGHVHEHKSEGFGDTEVIGLYSLYNAKVNDVTHKAHLNFGVSLPTGSINETFANHHNNVYHLPYNMQFGSGTYDPILGGTYTGKLRDWSWGAQTINYLRAGKNNNGYRLGNKYTATGWIARNLTDFASLSFRIDGEANENVSGRDISLPLTTIVGANPDKQAREQIFTNIGLNLLGGKENGILAGHRLGVEIGVPVYERFSGPQLSTDYRLTVGWQKSF